MIIILFYAYKAITLITLHQINPIDNFYDFINKIYTTR